MTKPPLGRLEKVNLREYWEHEALGFTPWLSQEDNLRLLAGTLGLVLEVEGTEANVGPYRADVLCREVGSEGYVLIENQIERTDHGHLGQIMTYAAGLDAVKIIWIASQFTDEHRAALDWLNRVTAEGIDFFGVEVELWRIGDSVAAPRFNLVSKPNDWAKRIKTAAKAAGGTEGTERGKQYRELWQELAAYLEENAAPFRLTSTRGTAWVYLPLGVEGFRFVTSYSSKSSRFNLYMLFRVDEADRYRHVRAHAAEVEQAVGQPIQWNDNDDGSGWGEMSFRLGADTAAEHAKGFEWVIQRGRGVQAAMSALWESYEPPVRPMDDGDAV